MKQTNVAQPLATFDEQKLLRPIHKRAEYQQNGFFYPELAIYYQQPAHIMGAFFHQTSYFSYKD